MVVTNSQALSEKIKLLREYGWSERYISSSQGWNSRLDEIQAAILRVKLKWLDENNSRAKPPAPMGRVAKAMLKYLRISSF